MEVRGSSTKPSCRGSFKVLAHEITGKIVRVSVIYSNWCWHPVTRKKPVKAEPAYKEVKAKN